MVSINTMHAVHAGMNDEDRASIDSCMHVYPQFRYLKYKVSQSTPAGRREPLCILKMSKHGRLMNYTVGLSKPSVIAGTRLSSMSGSQVWYIYERSKNVQNTSMLSFLVSHSLRNLTKHLWKGLHSHTRG